MKSNTAYYDVIQINEKISEKAVELIESYKLSHGLQIPDAIIGSTAIIFGIPLFTYNTKDFNFIPTIKLHPTV